MIEARDAAHGLPYVSAKDLVRIDVRTNRFISFSHGDLLEGLKLRENSILITCSGMNLGKAIWVRRDLDGLGGSGDLIRVLPNKEADVAGYIYAFLKSIYGWVSLRQLIFGGSIKHIEPKEVGRILVPRIGKGLERKCNALVSQSADMRFEASTQIAKAKEILRDHLGLSKLTAIPRKDCTSTVTRFSEISTTSRLDGYFYNAKAKRVDEFIENHKRGFWHLSEIAEVFDVPPFKHIYVSPQQGIPFFTSSDLFSIERTSRLYLSRTQTRNLSSYVIREGTVLLARSGQVGGIIGRPQYADSALNGCATSDHVIRIVSKAPKDIPPGFLFAYLDIDEIGYPLLTRTIAGKSVPALWPIYLNGIKVLKAGLEVRNMVHELVAAAFELRIKATSLEHKAIAIVEQAIEENA
jgi:type I restriction enzyme S subunit